MSIESLRSRFEEEIKKNHSLYHPIDIERVRTEDWQVKRYLNEYETNEDQAFNLLVKAMRWKKEFGIHERDDEFFPKEFWELTECEITGRDKKGRLIQIEVFKKQCHFKELNLLHRQFVAHILEKLDRKAGEDGYVILLDIKGAGISNIDLDLNKFKINLNELYAGGLRQMFCIDLPWLLNPIMKIIVSFMSPKLQQILIYVKREQLLEYIDADQLPISLSGTKEKHSYPTNLKSMDQCFQRLGLTEKFVDQYYNHHKIKRN